MQMFIAVQQAVFVFGLALSVDRHRFVAALVCRAAGRSGELRYLVKLL